LQSPQWAALLFSETHSSPHQTLPLPQLSYELLVPAEPSVCACWPELPASPLPPSP
jgi:hypothetical protein